MSIDLKCSRCQSTNLLQGSDYVNLRPLDTTMSFGCKKIYTFCGDCGEVLSIKIENPEKLKN